MTAHKGTAHTHSPIKGTGALHSKSPQHRGPHYPHHNLGALTIHQVDLRAQQEDLIGQALGGGQHFSVVGADEILHELLQLVPVHLGQRLRDGQPQLHLAGVPNAVQRQGHHVGAVEEVAVITATAHRCDLAAVKADGDVVDVPRLSRAPRFLDVSAQVES